MGFLFPDVELKEEIERLKRANCDLKREIYNSRMHHLREVESLESELSERIDAKFKLHIVERDLRHLKRDHELLKSCFDRRVRQITCLSNENRELEIRVSELRESLRVCCKKNNTE